MSPTKKRRKSPPKITVTTGKRYLCDEKKVVKTQEIAMRHEEFHRHFINYDQIADYLARLSREHESKIKVTDIGNSSHGKKIWMAKISTNKPSESDPQPSIMIEAGLNGRDWMAVSNALFLIDYLVKTEGIVILMDYYIIPCSNPDAYINSFNPPIRYCQHRPPEGVTMDLTQNFPTMLGVTNPSDISTREYLTAIQQWKENYAHETPECYALLNAIYNVHTAVKLYISLQQGGKHIMYPFGFGKTPPPDLEDLRKVAWSGRNAMKTRCFSYGTIHDLIGLNFGNILDFLRIQRNMMKFSYVIQVTKTCEEKDVKQIIRYGCETMRCIMVMSAAVYKYYNKDEGEEMEECNEGNCEANKEKEPKKKKEKRRSQKTCKCKPKSKKKDSNQN